MEKQILRRNIIQKRRSLSAEYRHLAGIRIQKSLISHPAYQNSHTLFVYTSMPDEPDTHQLLEQAWSDNKKVYLPLCLPHSCGQMLAVRVKSWDDLTPKTFGILEPKEIKETISLAQLDLVVVPCLTASLSGKRLGHGAGYYDRFLSSCTAETRRAKLFCLCFHELVTEDILMTEQDIWMDAVITEKGYFSAFDCLS